MRANFVARELGCRMAEGNAGLKSSGCSGAFSIEHELEDHNPLPEVKTSLERPQSWLKN